ncbi:MAG: hypothetical protein ABJF25_29985 [Rhodopirellula bahusiensis]
MRSHSGIAGECQHDLPILAIGGRDAPFDPTRIDEELPVGIPANRHGLFGERIGRDHLVTHSTIENFPRTTNTSSHRVLRQPGLGFPLGHFAGLGFQPDSKVLCIGLGDRRDLAIGTEESHEVPLNVFQLAVGGLGPIAAVDVGRAPLAQRDLGLGSLRLSTLHQSPVGQSVVLAIRQGLHPRHHVLWLCLIVLDAIRQPIQLVGHVGRLRLGANLGTGVVRSTLPTDHNTDFKRVTLGAFDTRHLFNSIS